MGAPGHLSPRHQKLVGAKCHCPALSAEPSALGRKESGARVSEALAYMLCGLRLLSCIAGARLPGFPGSGSAGLRLGVANGRFQRVGKREKLGCPPLSVSPLAFLAAAVLCS